MHRIFLSLCFIALICGCSVGLDRKSWTYQAAMHSMTVEDPMTDDEALATFERYFLPDCAVKPKSERSKCMAIIEDARISDSGSFNPTFFNKFKNSDSDAQVKLRDLMIQEMIRASDRLFLGYRVYLSASRATFDSGASVIATALSTTASIATGGVTPRILSGVSALTTGAQATIEKNYLASQSTSALVSTMNANRTTRQIAILQKKGASIARYDLQAAANDIIDMNRQGSLIAAIDAVQSTAATSESNATAALKTMRAIAQ